MSMLYKLKRQHTKLSILDRDWYTFVYDHRDYIRNNSAVIKIDDVMLARFEHKIDHMLRSNNCNKQLLWIGRLINTLNFLSPLQLGTVIYVPSMSFIEQLYRQYQTSTKVA